MPRAMWRWHGIPISAATLRRALGEALNQGITAGTNAVGGQESYDRLPYFFSDQYELGMEYVGFAQPDDPVVIRGSTADREFIAFWQRDGVVTAAMNVNVWDVVEDLKAIIAAGTTIDAGRLADPDVPLADLAGLGGAAPGPLERRQVPRPTTFRR